MLASFELLDRNLSKNMSDKVQGWSDRFFKWPGLKRPVLSSSIKLMLLEGPDLMMAREEITKFKELCFKLSIKWTASNQEVISKSLWQQIDLILWIQPWWDQAELIERYNLDYLIYKEEFIFLKFTQNTCQYKKGFDTNYWLDFALTQQALNFDLFVLKPECLRFVEEEKLLPKRILSKPLTRSLKDTKNSVLLASIWSTIENLLI